MRIDERVRGEVVILDLIGKITLGEGDEMLRDKINELVASGRHRDVLLNFAEVPYIDSSGLSEFVRSYTVVRNRGGRMRIIDLTARIQDLLSVTKLASLVEVHEGRDFPDPAASVPWIAVCPVCVPDTPIALKAIPSFNTCGRCGLSLKLTGWDTAPLDAAAAECRTVALPSYDGQRVLLEIREAQIVTVEGRLDVFAMESVQVIWNLLTPVRRVMFIIRQDQFSDQGLIRWSAG